MIRFSDFMGERFGIPKGVVKARESSPEPSPEARGGSDTNSSGDTRTELEVKILGEEFPPGPRLDEYYFETAEFLETTLRRVQGGGGLDAGAVDDRVELLINQVMTWKESWLIPIRRHNPANFLYTHSLNVAILSVLAGTWLGYNRWKLKSLATGALLIDIGTPHFMDTCMLPRPLTGSEESAIQSHALIAAEEMRRAGFDNQSVRLVMEHHERVDRRGYPHGIGENAIHDLAKIVRVMDAYDALIHSRPHRRRFTPEAAMREILSERDAYSAQIVKLMLERIGFHPPGSWIVLSTGEIARVLGVNPGQMFRPTVSVMLDRNRDRLSSFRTLDLSRQTGIRIERSFDEEAFKAGADEGHTA